MGESIWKKEIRLRKPKEQRAEPVETQNVAAPAPRPRGTVVVPVVPAQSDAVRRLTRAAGNTSFPRPAAGGDGKDPAALLRAERAADPAQTPPAPPEPAPIPLEVHAPIPVEAPEPIPVEFDPPVPVEMHAPVPAPVAAAVAVAVAQEKVPLLKREITLRRKPKAPKAPKEPKPKDDTPKPSLLKREIKLSRPKRAPREKVAGGAARASRVVGLRIGSSQIAAAHVENNGSAHLVQFARKPIARGLVVAGEVREPATLIKELKSFFADNKLPRKDIRLGIASNRIGVRVLEVPSVADEKQFENAVRFRAQEVLPIPVTDAVLDHVTLSEAPNAEGGTTRRILLVFAHRELVNRYVDVCKQAGLRLTGIDLDAFALLRAVAAPASADGTHNAVVAVSVGHERTIFAVSDGEVCEFTRVLEWGSSAIEVAIARTLGLTPSQAEPIKHAISLAGDEPRAGLSAVQLEAVRAAVTSEIGVLVRELVSSLRFYQSQPGSLAIAEVLLTGGGAQLDGFAAELEEGLGAPVRLADPFTRVTLGKKLAAPQDQASLAIAVGLGIEV